MQNFLEKFLFVGMISVLSSVMAADNTSSNVTTEGNYITRVKAVAPDTYVDFPISTVETLSVVLSNDTCVASPYSITVPKSNDASVSHTLGIRRYRGKCGIYIDGRQKVLSPDIWKGPLDVNVTTNAIPNDKGDVYEQKLAPFSFADSFMVAQGDKSGLGSWEVLNGDWTLHAATGRMVRAEDKLTLTRFPTQERSPNFYCLNAFGKDAVITAGEQFYSHYAIRASLQQNTGTNGIAFLLDDSGQGYTFTAQTDENSGRLNFILRDKCIPGESCGEFVAGVKTELTPGQWYMLESRLTDSDIICYVDNIPVIRVQRPLQAGGFFGLYSNTLEAEPARFDDVSAETWTGTDLSLDTSYERKSRDSFGVENDPSPEITISADISDGHSIALYAGGSADNAAYTLLCSATGKGNSGLEVRLTSHLNDSIVTNDVWIDSTFFANKTDHFHEFTLDTTVDGLIAGRIDNHTVVLAPAVCPATGPAGYFTDIPEKALAKTIGVPSVNRRPAKYTDQFEKNKLFVIDPYMRHWASTAGQWLTYTNIAWYKDDVLNRVSLELPAIDGIDLRLGVGENTEDGDVRIVCESNNLTITTALVTNNAPVFTWKYQPAKMVDDKGAMTATNSLSVRYDGNRLALISPTGCLFTCAVPFPHAGRKMFFKKFPANYLGNVVVRREPVLDCLFSESLHDWIINGGTWEVINRFQCYPEWSHMDGENPNSVAALWSKFEISGDFAAMFICGMRHGWYENVGNFNLTVMCDNMTPSKGYTLNVTGWNPNQTQKWTRLFRNGEMIAQSDTYAAPRRRNANRRLGYEPLLASGRDVHGAWYSIKFRKLKDKLEAYFDNRPLISATDPSPLSTGGIGIWTYKSSMVVARVRITADSIRPRPFKFEPLPKISPSGIALHEDNAVPNLYFNGLPIDMLRPEFWHADDEVNYPELSFAEEDGEQVMTVTSTHGSGSFLVAPNFPLVTANALAGWSFEVARSENAEFNFEFSCSNETVRTSFSHVISGSGETMGPRVISGVSPLPEPTKNGAEKKIWTPVKVWIPATGVIPTAYFVRFEGFGNLQPSDVQQGLHGNGPGEWYAIRRLSPIFRGTPSADNSSENTQAFSQTVKNALDKEVDGKINEFRIPQSISKHQPSLLWVLPPADNQGLIATISGAPENVIRVSSTLEWPNPLLSTDSLKINDSDVPHAFIKDNTLVIPYPRPFDPKANQYTKLSFKTTDGRSFTQILQSDAFAKANKETPIPIITSLEFPKELNAMYINFESRDVKLDPFGQNRRLNFDDPVQSTYIRYFCINPRDSLRGSLCQRYDFIHNPLVQFRYRGEEFSKVKFNVRPGVFYAFNSPTTGSKSEMILDDSWHTMVANLSAINHDRRPGGIYGSPSMPLSFSSTGIDGYGSNYNGPYSYIDFDDIAIGPCIGPSNSKLFSFRPSFDSTNELGSAEYAISDGNTPYDGLTDEASQKIQWTSFNPVSTNMVTPDISGLSNGPHHLFVRAKSTSGALSRVADIPFIYDAVPPSVVITTYTNEPSLFNGTTLKAIISGGVDQAPISLSDFKFTLNGKTLTMRDGLCGRCVVMKENNYFFDINWPYVARSQIQQSKNGDKLTFVTAMCADGSGNVAKPVTNTIAIDYASDHRPPCHQTPMRATTFYGNGNIASADSFFIPVGGTTVSKFIAGDGKDILSLTVKGEPKSATSNAFIDFKNQLWLVPTNRWLMLRARIPEGAPVSDKTAFTLNLHVAAMPKDIKNPPPNAVFSVKIPTAASTNQTELIPGLYGTIDFTPGKWVELALDVNEFLKTKSGAQKFEFRISRLQLMLPPVKGYTLEINAAVIMKDIQNINRSLSFNAYDASGIDGIFMRGAKILDGWEFTPKMLYEKSDGSIFPEIKLGDRAGNMTKGLLIPLPPMQQ